MSLESVENIDSCRIPLDPRKVKLPDDICLSIGKTLDYIVYLGNRVIFSSNMESRAREFYDKVKSDLEKGCYTLVIYPSLTAELERKS